MKVIFLCLAAAAIPAFAEPLGRLFFTPEQRLLFDRQREQGDGASAESAIRLDGRMAGFRRNPVVWVNGRMHGESALNDGLRVGESVNLVTRTRTDVVPDGSVIRSAR